MPTHIRRAGLAAGALAVVGTVVLSGASTASGATPAAAAGPGIQPPLNVLVQNDGTAPVPMTGKVEVGNLPATQNVAGTVGVNNFPATQNVAGTVGVNNFPATQEVTGTVAVQPRESIRTSGHLSFPPGTAERQEATLSTKTLSEARLNMRCDQPPGACQGARADVYSYSGDVPYLIDSFVFGSTGFHSSVYESPGSSLRVAMTGRNLEFYNTFRIEVVGRP